MVLLPICFYLSVLRNRHVKKSDIKNWFSHQNYYQYLVVVIIESKFETIEIYFHRFFLFNMMRCLFDFYSDRAIFLLMWSWTCEFFFIRDFFVPFFQFAPINFPITILVERKSFLCDIKWLNSKFSNCGWILSPLN